MLDPERLSNPPEPTVRTDARAADYLMGCTKRYGQELGKLVYDYDTTRSLDVYDNLVLKVARAFNNPDNGPYAKLTRVQAVKVMMDIRAGIRPKGHADQMIKNAQPPQDHSVR